MKHMFSSAFNFKKVMKTDKYYRAMTIIELFVSLLAVFAVIMKRIPSMKDFAWSVFLICAFLTILLVFVFFIVRIVKAKVVDWSQIFFIIVWSALVLILVHDAGGWSAVFPAM